MQQENAIGQVSLINWTEQGLGSRVLMLTDDDDLVWSGVGQIDAGDKTLR